MLSELYLQDRHQFGFTSGDNRRLCRCDVSEWRDHRLYLSGLAPTGLRSLNPEVIFDVGK